MAFCVSRKCKVGFDAPCATLTCSLSFHIASRTIPSALGACNITIYNGIFELSRDEVFLLANSVSNCRWCMLTHLVSRRSPTVRRTNKLIVRQTKQHRG